MIEDGVDKNNNNFLKSNGTNVGDSDYWGKDKFKLRVDFNDYFFNRLQERGKIETRQNMPPSGSEIRLIDISTLGGIENFWVNEMD